MKKGLGYMGMGALLTLIASTANKASGVPLRTGEAVRLPVGKRGYVPGTVVRVGNRERKDRQRELRELTRWLGTKPGQRGENPPFTGRRHRKAA